MPQGDESLQHAAWLFKIVTIIFAIPLGNPLGRDELSFACGCGVKTIHLDIQVSRKACVPQKYDLCLRSYWLRHKDWAFPIVPLTAQDAIAIARGLLTASGAPHYSNDCGLTLDCLSLPVQ